MLDHQHIAPPGVRLPMDLSSSQFHDQPHQQMPLNPVFLNPINMPFPGPEKGPAPPQVREGGGESARCKTLLQVGQFPLLDPRLQYLQWASNPLTNPYLRTPHQAPPLAPPYLQGLQQFQHLKTLQQNLAKTLLASQAPHHSNCEYWVWCDGQTGVASIGQKYFTITGGTVVILWLLCGKFHPLLINPNNNCGWC